MTDTSSTESPVYNPGDWTAAEVKAHLDTVDPTEFARIIGVEKAGQNRTSIVNYTQSSGSGKPDADGYTRKVVSID